MQTLTAPDIHAVAAAPAATSTATAWAWQQIRAATHRFPALDRFALLAAAAIYDEAAAAQATDPDRILEVALAGITAAEIGRRCGLMPAATYPHCRELTERGLLTRQPDYRFTLNLAPEAP